MTGGRLKRIRNFIGDEPFFMTYGDGVSDVDINALLDFHKKHGKLATMSAVKPESRFGVLDLAENNEVRAFREKVILTQAGLTQALWYLSRRFWTI